MSFNGSAFGAAKTLISQYASGYDHSTKTGDNTFDIYFTDGSKISITIPGISTSDLDAIFNARVYVTDEEPSSTDNFVLAIEDDGEDEDAEEYLTKSEVEDYIDTEIDGVKSELVRIVPYDLVTYMGTEKESVKARIKALTNNISNPIIVGFSTDQHCKIDVSGDWIQKKEDITQGIKALANLTYDIDFDIVVGGGDSVYTNGSKEEITQIVSLLDKCKCPTFNLTGNHDAYDGYGTDYDFYYPHITNSVEAERTKMYSSVNWNNSGYMDSAKHKVRFIFCDNWVRNNGTVRNEFTTALTSMLSSMPNGYKAIIFSHIGIDGTLPTNPSDRTVGWNNVYDCKSTLIPYADKIICVINGHNHNDLSAYVNGIRHISTTTSGYNELNDGLTRANGTSKSTVFDTYVIDTENNKIYIVRFGVGTDRECNIKETYVRDDAISNSINSDGTTYNDIGYKVGYRLNSSGADASITSEVVASEVAVTGYIAFTQNDVIYFQDGMLPPTENAVQSISGISSTYSACNASMNIALYDSSFTKRYSRSISATYSDIGGTTDSYFANITLYASGCIKSMKLVDSNTAYIRFNSFNIQNGKLAMVNEEV